MQRVAHGGGGGTVSQPGSSHSGCVLLVSGSQEISPGPNPRLAVVPMLFGEVSLYGEVECN